MTDRRFALCDHLLSTRPWELFVMVEMGTDRIHHGFWKFMDAEHRKHVPGNPYEHAIRDYYRHVDGLIGNLLRHADEDTTFSSSPTTVRSVWTAESASTSGSGGRGYSSPSSEPTERARLEKLGIDWSRTIAWGEGGYYFPASS